MLPVLWCFATHPEVLKSSSDKTPAIREHLYTHTHTHLLYFAWNSPCISKRCILYTCTSIINDTLLNFILKIKSNERQRGLMYLFQDKSYRPFSRQ